MRKAKVYQSMDSIVESVAQPSEILGVYASGVEERVGLIQTIIDFLTSHWVEKIILIATFAFFFSLYASGVPAPIPELVFAGGLLGYAFYKGQTIKPSILVATKDKVYLIDGVTFNRENKTYSYEEIEIAGYDRVGSFFRMAQLNPVFHMIAFDFKINDKKYTAIKSPLLALIYAGDFPKKSEVSRSEIRRIIFQR